MLRNSVIVVAALGGLYLPGQAFAQALPPAGSAGAGSAPVSGVPYGPANPRSLSDPSGIGNAGSTPPLRSNFGAYTSTPPVASVQSPRVQTVEPLYPGGSQRIGSPHAVESKDSDKPSPRRRPRPEVSHFTGICRGC